MQGKYCENNKWTNHWTQLTELRVHTLVSNSSAKNFLWCAPLSSAQSTEVPVVVASFRSGASNNPYVLLKIKPGLSAKQYRLDTAAHFSSTGKKAI